MTRGQKLAIAIVAGLVPVLLFWLTTHWLMTSSSHVAADTWSDATQVEAHAGPLTPPAPGDRPTPDRAITPMAHDAGPSAVTHVLRATDAHDRDLLAAVERLTKASPPKAVYELIALRRSGATRDELQRFIDRELSGRLPIRVAASRWLRATLPRPGQGAQPAQPPPMGSGGGRKLLQPIEPARAR
jgi:hypothetical protein